jgi:hypothetical protein
MVACGGRDSVPADTSRVQLPAPAMTADSARVVVPDPCPSTGQWALCSLEKRLKRSGFVMQRLEGDTVRRPGFSVTPAVYKLGRGRLEVFLYESEAALMADLAAIDTVSVAPRGAAGTWPSPPALVRSGNVAAVFMDQTARQAERLVLAVTAGAPLAR